MTIKLNAAVVQIISTILASSCAIPQPLPTGTGKPEVVFKGKDVSRKIIVDKLAYYLIGEGYKIERVDQYSAVFIKHGSTWRYVDKKSFKQAQDERITLNMIDSDDGITVIGTVETVKYPHGQGSIVSDKSRYGARAEWLFQLLYRVSSEISGGKNKGGLAEKRV